MRDAERMVVAKAFPLIVKARVKCDNNPQFWIIIMKSLYGMHQHRFPENQEKLFRQGGVHAVACTARYDDGKLIQDLHDKHWIAIGKELVFLFHGFFVGFDGEIKSGEC